MNHLFLHNPAVDVSDFNVFKYGMSMLNRVKVATTSKDEFLKHNSVWSLPVLLKLYADPSREAKAIIMLIGQIKDFSENIPSADKFDDLFPNTCNGFIGVTFEKLDIPLDRQIIDEASFKLFKKSCLEDVNFRDFWEKREEILPNIVLCGEVESQISLIGNSSLFNQVLYRLKALDEYAAQWIDGNFNYKEVNNSTSLKISPESDSTLNLYASQRTFSLPDGRRELCDLHIKTGNLRFHFYPDNNQHKIYVAYIGQHLKTFTG